MASEDALAEYFAEVLPKLVEVGATGAVAWCFADYHKSLWDRPPCSESWHERFFGMIRPDGSLKPHAKVLRDFAATHPKVKPAVRSISLPYPPADFYNNTWDYLLDLYAQWKGAE